MAFENCAEAYAEAVAGPVKMAGKALDLIHGYEAQAGRMEAALRGGCSDFGTVDDINKVKNDGIAEQKQKGAEAVDSIRAALAGFVDSVFTFDPSDVAAVSPAVSVCSSDDDYRRLAQGNRNSLGALKAVAAADNAFSRGLNVSLAHYEEVVGAACRKAGDFASRALTGMGDVKDGDALAFLVSLQRDKIEAAWNDLTATIDGASETDPFMAALLGMGARRA